MIKETRTYVDYDDVERTEDFYFNLSKAELLEMQASESGGLDKYIERITKEQDMKKIIAFFKELVLMAYGKKSDDGKRFIKSEEISKEFSETEAYSDLFMELATDADKAAKFVNGLIPKDLAAEVEATEKKKALKEVTNA